MFDSRILPSNRTVSSCPPFSLALARAGSIVLAAASLTYGIGPAIAGNAYITVGVSAVPTSVSTSRSGLTTYAAYEVTIKNNTTNVINQVIFTANTTVSNSTQAAPYVESIPAAACGVVTASSSIQCDVGQLRGVADATGSVAKFVVLFSAPSTGDAIVLHSQITYSRAASPGAPPSTLPRPIPDVSTNLVTQLSADINSGFLTYIPSFGGTFFTGRDATALSTNTATTLARIPKGLGLSTAQVVEVVSNGGLSSDTSTTNTRTITVPGAFPFALPITIELRRDASTINAANIDRDASTVNADQIDRAVILYSHDDITPVFNALPNCQAYAGPTVLLPVCIFSRTSFTSSTAPTPDDIGDWLFVIKALENGSFKD